MILTDLALNQKKVLVRVDFNVPLNASREILDDTRMQAALPTLRYLLDQGAAVIIMSHLGRPQKKLTASGDLDVEKFTLQHLVDHLASLLAVPVYFASNCVGEEAKEKAANLKEGEVLLLENTRFHKEEKKGDPAFAQQLASLADIYINDAFGTAHRAHASTTTVANYFPKEAKAFGFLIEKEIKNGNRVLHDPARPLTAIIGGAKVSDKILLIEKLIDFADRLLIGGGMAYTFIKAMGGHIGKSLVEEDRLEIARTLIQKAKEKNTELVLPIDSIIADQFAADAQTQIVDSHLIPEGWMGLDIGPEAVKQFNKVILSSKTLLWNGPMGVFEMEAFKQGTLSVGKCIVEATEEGSFSLVGGGDSVSALNQMNLADSVSYASTGGGAMLEFLEGKKLPGIAAIES